MESGLFSKDFLKIFRKKCNKLLFCMPLSIEAPLLAFASKRRAVLTRHGIGRAVAGKVKKVKLTKYKDISRILLLGSEPDYFFNNSSAIEGELGIGTNIGSVVICACLCHHNILIINF